MKKTILLYCRRNTGIYALMFLVAKGFRVIVVTDDENVMAVAKSLECLVTKFEHIPMIAYSLLLCVHGNRILPKQWLDGNLCVNVHPCLEKGYKGANPINKYIAFGDKWADVSSHYMVEQVDEGEIIEVERFYTGKVVDFANFYNIAAFHYLVLIDKTLNKLNIKP